MDFISRWLISKLRSLYNEKWLSAWIAGMPTEEFYAQQFCRLYLIPGFCHTMNPGGINYVSDENQMRERYAFFRKLYDGNTGPGLIHTIDRWVCSGELPDMYGSDLAPGRKDHW